MKAGLAQESMSELVEFGPAAVIMPDKGRPRRAGTLPAAQSRSYGAVGLLFFRLRETVKSLKCLRFWIVLSLGIAVALVAYHWPASPRAVMHYDYSCWHFAFSRDSTKLALLDREPGLNVQSQILVWDVATGKLLHRFDNGTKLYPSKVIFAPDGTSLGIVDAGTVTKWDLNTGRMVANHDRRPHRRRDWHVCHGGQTWHDGQNRLYVQRRRHHRSLFWKHRPVGRSIRRHRPAMRVRNRSYRHEL